MRKIATVRTTATVTSLAIALAGCATASRDVPTAYVSPLQYQSYDCDQLGAESRRLNTRVQQLGGRLDEAANNDQAIMAVTLVLFWPAAFALGGTKAQEAEYARFKGEADAINQAAIARKCGGLMPAVAAVPPIVSSPGQAAPAAPAPRPFRPAACDWPGAKQGVGAC
jgi:hypothetical protein